MCVCNYLASDLMLKFLSLIYLFTQHIPLHVGYCAKFRGYERELDSLCVQEVNGWRLAHMYISIMIEAKRII